MASIHTLARSCPILFVVSSVVLGEFPTLSLLSRRRLELGIVFLFPLPSCWMSLIISS
nr:MAG TPA: hypothetical protein [Caudoviricetes sp.]